MHTNRLGVTVLGLATMAAGILDLIWGDFEAGHQPIQAFGDHIPGRAAMAYIAAIWMIVAGAAILWRRTEKPAAVAVAVIYAIFGVFWLPRLVTAPAVLGYHPGVYFGVLGGVAQQLIIVAAAAIVYTKNAVPAARWVIGLCSVDFGLAHLTSMEPVVQMVPKWLPLGGEFWAALTGIAFVLAGLAILSGVRDVLASRLLALMLLVFSALVLAPLPFGSPHDHVAWGGNAYNLAAAAAIWIYADALVRDRQRKPTGTP